jgi:hypothetical protein
LGRFGKIWEDLGRPGKIQEDLGRFVKIWEVLGRVSIVLEKCLKLGKGFLNFGRVSRILNRFKDLREI